MSDTNVNRAGHTNASPARTLERDVERDLARGRPRSAEERALDRFVDVARDVDGAAAAGATLLDLRPGDDLEARGPGSAFDRLATRMGETPATCEGFALCFADADRDRFTALVRERMPGADAEAIATLCEDLAACAFQRLVVREVRADLAEAAATMRTLASDPAARERFLLGLGQAGAESASTSLERLGLQPADAAAAGLALEGAACAASVTCVEREAISLGGGSVVTRTVERPCGAPVEFETLDATVAAAARDTMARIGEMSAALSESGATFSPVSVFEDYGPPAQRVLDGIGLDEPAGMLDAGIRRALDERASDHLLEEGVRAVVAIAADALGGPAGPAVNAALRSAEVVREGANHDRIEAQRALGISDERASEFEGWGEAASRAAVQWAVSVGTGHAVDHGLGSGRAIGAIAGEAAAHAYALGLEWLRGR